MNAAMQTVLQDITAKLPMDIDGPGPAKRSKLIGSSSSICRRQEIIASIEGVVESFITSLCQDAETLKFQFPEFCWENTEFSDRVRMKDPENAKYRVVSFDSARSRPKMALMTRVLEKVYSLLRVGGTVSQRELYYQLLPSSQNLLTTAIHDVCALLGAAPWELGVLAASKGLVVGPLTLYMPGETIDCSASGAVLIPQDLVHLERLESTAKFVLVVEKDAIFRKLIDEGALARLQPFIMLTGKGFPDVVTRQLLSALWRSLHIPLFALVDADPHGIEIMCVYRFGSLNMALQSEDLAVPALRWLGIHPSDIERLVFPAESLQPLTDRDINKTRDLLARPYIQQSPALKAQVQKLLDLGRKAEIEAVGKFSKAYLTDVFLPSKICSRELI